MILHSLTMNQNEDEFILMYLYGSLYMHAVFEKIICNKINMKILNLDKAIVSICNVKYLERLYIVNSRIFILNVEF